MSSSFDRDFASRPRNFLDEHLIVADETAIEDKNRTKIVKVQGLVNDEEVMVDKIVNKTIKTGFFTLSEHDQYKITNNATKKILKLNYVPTARLNQTLSEVGVGDDGIKAYWLSYVHSVAKRRIISNEAQYMFTAEMSGCTVGYGSQYDTGHILVSHSNAQEQATRHIIEENKKIKASKGPSYSITQEERNALNIDKLKFQAEEQKSMLESKLSRKNIDDTTLKYFEPKNYQKEAYWFGRWHEVGLQYRATVIAVRRNKIWNFYNQRYAVLPDGRNISWFDTRNM